MRRDPPQIRWRAVLIGGAVALLASVVVAGLATVAGSPLLYLFATPAGLAAGGAVAGRISGQFGLYQGGMVGVLWVVAEALADVVDPQAADVLADVALVVLADAGRIALAGAAGWIAARSVRPSSSADRDRGR